MTRKPVLIPTRLRRPPSTGWSWVDRRFFREHMAYLSREAVLLYYFLCDTADRHGQSFFGDATLAGSLRINLPTLLQARDELLARDLIAHEVRFTQVLSLPQARHRCHGDLAPGPMQLGDILRQAIAATRSSEEGARP
jgi:hypothetical protein